MSRTVMFACLTAFLAAYASEASSQGAIKPENVLKLQELLQPTIDEMGGGGKTVLRESDADLAVPDAPAFAVLGVTPETVIRPTSPKQFATGILNGVDENGNLQTGLAIETAPYLLFGGNELTIQEYNNDFVRRFLARTGLSVATTKGSDDDESVRFSPALTIALWDRGDPRVMQQEGSRRDLVGCMAKAWKPVSAAVQTAINNDEEINKLLRGESSELTEDKVKAIVLKYLGAPGEKTVRKCREDFREAAWNASSWNIGVAPTWVSPNGEIGDLEWSGAAFYTTLAYGFEGTSDLLEDNAQLLLHARYRMDEEFADSDAPDDFFEQDTLTLGGQLRFAGPTITNSGTTGGPDLNFLAEGSYIIQDRSGRPNESFLRYAVGAEYRLSEGLYLKASAGTTDGRDESSDESFLLFNLKWNFSAKPTLR